MEANSYCYLRHAASVQGKAPARQNNWYFYLRHLSATGLGQRRARAHATEVKRARGARSIDGYRGEGPGRGTALSPDRIA